MQISKCLLTVCAAVCVLSVRAADNQAQIKAREALEKALNQPGQPVEPAPASSPTVQPPPAPVAPPATVSAPADSEAISRAREALEQKMNQIQGQPAQPAPAPAPVVSQPPPPKRRAKPQAAPQPPMTVQAPAAPALNPAPAAVDDSIAKAREALREKMQTLGAEPAPTPPAPAFAQPQAPAAPPVAAAPAVQPPAAPAYNALPEPESADVAKARESVRTTLDAMPDQPSPDKAGKVGMNFPRLQAPPLGISADKQQKLQNLLQQYKMDLISPEQYQAARAKILAGQ
jgi:fused signal recognition particle receptor